MANVAVTTMPTAFDDLFEAFPAGWSSVPASSEPSVASDASSRSAAKSSTESSGSAHDLLEQELKRLSMNGDRASNAPEAALKSKPATSPDAAAAPAKQQSQDDDILEALLGPSPARAPSSIQQKRPEASSSRNGSAYPSFRANGPSQARSEWKGFSGSAVGKSSASMSKVASNRAQRSEKQPSSLDREPPQPSNSRDRHSAPPQASSIFNSTITKPNGKQRRDSSSSDESVKKYGKFAKKPVQISYKYGVDYNKKDGRTLPEFGKREPRKLKILGTAARRAAEERGERSRDPGSEEEGGDTFPNAKTAEPRGWRNYKRQSSSEDDQVEKAEKELLNEWELSDVEEPAVPLPKQPSAEFPGEGERLSGGAEYGPIAYGESVPGWEPNLTLREDPNMTREEKSMARFKRATAELESVTHVPDYIDPSDYRAPHLSFSRELVPREPEPEHWVAEEEEREQRRPRYRDRPSLDPAQSDYYTNPGGGYGIRDRSDGEKDPRDEPWIKPRKPQESLDQMDPYRASWENQRRGIAGHFNARNRGM